MRFQRSYLPLLAVLAVWIGPLATTARAQAGADLGTMVTNSLTHMNNEEWVKALQLLTQASDRFGKNAAMLFGPKFGVIWYRRGFCELKVGKFEDAMKSFEKCYRDFPNKGGQVAGGGNPYHSRALLKWGEAAQGAEDYQQAVRMYKKFLEERDKARDKFPLGAFYINMAICHFKLGKIPEGLEFLEIAIKNKEIFPTPDAGIVAGFQGLVEAVIEKRNEQALLDFVAKNRADIIIEPFEMTPYSKLFMKLAADAVNAQMERAAMTLYQMVPATSVAVQDIKVRIDQLGTRRGVMDLGRALSLKELEEGLAELEKTVSAGKQTEATALAAMAFMHETKYGNARAAFGAYEQLELYYNKDKVKRESNLYNLVRTSSVIGEVFFTEEYGRNFLKLYPESKHVPAVRRMMLTSLFYEGEYKKCIEVASVMIDRLTVGSLEHDICLHVLGGSYYYEGTYEKAQPLLDQHVEKYEKSKFRQAALYFQASNLSRLQFWAKAAKLLDAFFEAYPDAGQNVFFPFALFDRANCHYAENEFEPALDKLNRLEADFPTAEVIDMAYNLKGNVLQTEEQYEEAEAYYKKALELSERRENRAVSSESLYYLVAMLGEKKRGKEENPRIKEAVPFADKFWEQYPESPYKTQVAVSQLYAMDAVGRGEEALERLRDVIGDMASNQSTLGLEEAINSYTEAYLEKHTPTELKDHYYAFPKIRASDKPARALLRIAVIGVFEEMVKKSKDVDEKRNSQAMIKVLFQELKRDFDPKDLSNYILVRLGDYLRTRTSAPRQALPYFDEALNRKDTSYRFPALFGRADVLAGGNAEEKTKAEADLRLVFNDSNDRLEKESALYRIIQVEMANKKFENADKSAREYLDRDGLNFTQHSAQVGLILAQSFEGRGMVNDALAMYAKVWSAHMGLVTVSAPAMEAWMKLSWQRDLKAAAEGGKADRQGAYEGGWAYVDLTKRFFDKMSPEEQDMWKEIEALVAKYEAFPGIKSMAVIKAEKEAAR